MRRRDGGIRRGCFAGGLLLLLGLLPVPGPVAAQALPRTGSVDGGALFLCPQTLALPSAARAVTVHAYPEARLVRIGDPGALAPAMRASITPIEETDRIDYRAWSGEYPHLSPEDLRGLPRALYLVSLAGPVDPDWLPRFEASGLSLLDHANPYSILVRGDGDGLRRATTVRTSAGFPVVKSVVPLPIEARLDATLLELASGRRRVEEIPGLLRTADGAAVVRALPFPDGDSESLLFQVGQHLAKVEPRLAHGYDDAFAARGPELPALLKDLEEIAHLEVVHERELHNNLAAKSYILNIEPVWSSLGYNGAGVIVGHNDSGVSLTHPDFPTGVVIATAGAMSGTNNEHGTHVAGSVVGRGLAAGSPTNTSGCGDVTPPLSTVRGMAWGASLVANNIFDGGYTTETSMMQWSYGQGARLSTNSWGYTNDYNYDSYAVSVDTLVRDAATTAGNQELAILFSAGNSGSGASTVGSPGTAKNALTVGASQNDRCGSYVPSQQSGPNINTITTFSSRGPSQGRIKPDVVAVGADVLSVDSLNCSGTPRDPCEEGWDQAWTGTYYRLMPGTSMSTPITAGASAVFFEFFNSTFGANPSPALTKAAMINGAVDIGVGYPSYSQGWGRINLRQSIEGPPGGRINFLEQSASRLLTTGTNFTKTFSVFSTSPRLKITLVWTDPPGTAGSTAPLRNNLDLVVTAPSGTVYRGNQFTGAWSTPNASGSDTANNVENVFVQTPETGQWSVEVRGINVAANPPNLAGQDWAVVYSGDCADCSPLPAPSGLGAAVHSDNRIDLTWNSVPGAVDYRIYRSTTAGGPYSYLATVTAPTLSYADTSVAAGATYYYVVRSFGSGGSACESGNSNEASATATGVCDLPPLFTGISSATPQGDCSVTLSWAAGTAQCAGPVRYTIYRHTATPFTPDVSNRIATGVTGTTYSDASGFAASTTYHYIVRAVDESNGVEGTNATTASALPAAGSSAVNLYPASGVQTFDSWTAGSMGDWVTGYFTGSAADWRGARACSPTHSGANVLRYGGQFGNCGNDYTSNRHALARPPAIAVPVNASSVTLSFWHRWQWQTNSDGAQIWIGLEPTSYTYVSGSAITGAPYNGTAPGLGLAVWTGTQSTMVNSLVDLNAACNMISGNSGGCAGKTIYVGFGGYADSTGTADGWYIDDVVITANVPGACGGTPLDVEHLTVTSRQAGACTVEWQNPPGLPVAYGATRIGARTDTFPTGPADSPLASEVGLAGSHDSYTHTLAAGTTAHYRAFVNSAANFSGIWSGPGLTTRSAPQGTLAGPVQWAFSTGATSLASPRRGFNFAGVYVASNDRRLYAMQPGAGGGTWPAGWTPAPMNAPATMPPALLQIAAGDIPSSPATVRAAFAASTDGHVTAFDADTGAELWRSAKLGEMLVANPMLMHTGYGGIANLVLVGTRDAAGANAFCALQMGTGATAWCFTNASAQGGNGLGIGIISGPAFVDASWSHPSYPGWKRAFFASRGSATGSPNTLWAVRFNASQARLLWAANVGANDGAPTPGGTAGQLVVGNNAGEVRAVNTDTGAVVWTRSFAPGPVKEFVSYDAPRHRLLFSTEGAVWSIPADGSTGSDWSVPLVAPSRPLWRTNTPYVYVGACATAACTDGRLVELDSTTAWTAPKSVTLGQASWLGGPTIDVNASPPVLHVGSASGRVYTVQIPLP